LAEREGDVVEECMRDIAIFSGAAKNMKRKKN
jgi:hypothetical protein